MIGDAFTNARDRYLAVIKNFMESYNCTTRIDVFERTDRLMREGYALYESLKWRIRN